MDLWPVCAGKGWMLNHANQMIQPLKSASASLHSDKSIIRSANEAHNPGSALWASLEWIADKCLHAQGLLAPPDICPPRSYARILTAKRWTSGRVVSDNSAYPRTRVPPSCCALMTDTSSCLLTIIFLKTSSYFFWINFFLTSVSWFAQGTLHHIPAKTSGKQTLKLPLT